MAAAKCTFAGAMPLSVRVVGAAVHRCSSVNAFGKWFYTRIQHTKLTLVRGAN